MVKKSFINHEIAFHGFSHVIMDKEIDKSSIDCEVSGLNQIKKTKKINIKTISFPRNIVNKKFKVIELLHILHLKTI